MIVCFLVNIGMCACICIFVERGKILTSSRFRLSLFSLPCLYFFLRHTAVVMVTISITTNTAMVEETAITVFSRVEPFLSHFSPMYHQLSPAGHLEGKRTNKCYHLKTKGVKRSASEKWHLWCNFYILRHNEVILKWTSILKLSWVAHCPYTPECVSFSFLLFHRLCLQREPLPENLNAFLILLTA